MPPSEPPPQPDHKLPELRPDSRQKDASFPAAPAGSGLGADGSLTTIRRLETRGSSRSLASRQSRGVTVAEPFQAALRPLSKRQQMQINQQKRLRARRQKVEELWRLSKSMENEFAQARAQKKLDEERAAREAAVAHAHQEKDRQLTTVRGSIKRRRESAADLKLRLKRESAAEAERRKQERIKKQRQLEELRRRREAEEARRVQRIKEGKLRAKQQRLENQRQLEEAQALRMEEERKWKASQALRLQKLREEEEAEIARKAERAAKDKELRDAMRAKLEKEKAQKEAEERERQQELKAQIQAEKERQRKEAAEAFERKKIQDAERERKRQADLQKQRELRQKQIAEEKRQMEEQEQREQALAEKEQAKMEAQQEAMLAKAKAELERKIRWLKKYG